MKKLLVVALTTFCVLVPGTFVLATGTFSCEETNQTAQNVCEGVLNLKKIAEKRRISSIEAIKILDYNSGQDSQTQQIQADQFIADAESKFFLGKNESDVTQKILHFNSAGEKYQAAIAKFDAATKYLPLTTRNYDSIYTDKNLIMQAGGNFSGGGKDSTSWFREMFSWKNGQLLRTINRILGGIGIIYFLILGLKFIFSQGSDEKISNYKEQFGWIVVGLVVISLAEFIGFQVLDPTQRDIISGTGNNSATQNFYEKTKQVVRFFEYIVGGFMLINGLMSGYNLIMHGPKEESVSQEKKFLQSFLVGSIFILMAEVFVRIFSLQDGLTNARYLAITEIAGLVNYMLSFIAIIATIMLIFSSLYYIISFGDEEQMGRAKRILYSNILGVVIAFSAYTIARFLINV
ncbi:hypothetical protein HN954_03245 [bacterium]|jgi:hypothetical protein|nr:hypothetical protein [bacterium]MBT6832135.1 hypothetical protein [bacterium]MBT6996419.1 hypothetical protein [bacterium]MBT7772154.1 hypothetical protein [bacterium]